MTQRDSPTESGDATGTLTSTDRGFVSKLRRYARRATRSGALAGAAGAVTLLGSVRALRRGDRGKGLIRLFAGGLLATLAVGQRRRRRDAGVDQTDVVDTSPDVEDAATGAGAETGPRATGDEASEVARSSVDVETATREGGETIQDEQTDAGTKDEQTDAGTAEPDVSESDDTASGEAPLPGDDTDEEADESTLLRDEELERLGEAAFDEQSGRVPAPQQAFNVELLSLGAEAFWGISEADDTVVVTQNYDALDEQGEFRYVASSEVDDEDREVRIPDTVLNHWDDVAGGGTAVESGTGIVFVTVDDRSGDALLLVVPEQWAEELLEGDEE